MDAIHRGVFARNVPPTIPRRSPLSNHVRSFSLAPLGTLARHYVFARDTCERSRSSKKEQITCASTDRRDDMDFARSIDPLSMYSCRGLPPHVSDTVFQGESPDEHAARIQVSAGERRDAVHRRQPPFRHTLAQECSVLFSVQGDESFLMESLSIHLLFLIIIVDCRRR